MSNKLPIEETDESYMIPIGFGMMIVGAGAVAAAVFIAINHIKTEKFIKDSKERIRKMQFNNDLINSKKPIEYISKHLKRL